MSDSDVLNGLDLNSIQNSSLLANSNQSGTVLAIKLDNIKALPQVRTEFNDGFLVSDLATDKEDESESITVNSSLNALAESIKQRGLQNPIIVRRAHVDNDFSKPLIDDHYIIVSGERRFRAVKLLHDKQLKAIDSGTYDGQTDKDYSTIDCIVRDYNCATDVCLDQLTENIQRVDLDPFEIANSLALYQKNYLEQFGKKILKSELAAKFGKTMFWISQMTAFADLNPVDDLELIEFFKKGVISNSPRTGYEIIKLYRRDPEALLQCIRDYKANGRVVDRGVAIRFAKFLESKNSSDTNSEVLDSSINQPGLIVSSTDPMAEKQFNDNNDVQPSDNPTSDDYSEIKERDRSESPKMFSKHQESTAYTAGINATSSYTDRDTHETHDLSDTIRDDLTNEHDQDFNEVETDTQVFPAEVEVCSDDVDNNEEDRVEIRSINCEYTDQNGVAHSYELKVEDDFSSNTEITIIENGVEISIPLSSLKMISFNFK